MDLFRIRTRGPCWVISTSLQHEDKTLTQLMLHKHVISGLTSLQSVRRADYWNKSAITKAERIALIKPSRYETGSAWFFTAHLAAAVWAGGFVGLVCPLSEEPIWREASREEQHTAPGSLLNCDLRDCAWHSCPLSVGRRLSILQIICWSFNYSMFQRGREDGLL